MSTKSKTQYDLTEGGIVGKLLRVAVPIMGTQLMQMAYNLTDMFWLGRVGSDVVAAAGTAGMYLWLSQGPLLIGRMGAEIGVSQKMGQHDEESARRYSQNSLFLAIVIGIVFGAVLMLFHRPLIGFFNIQEANVAADARVYLLLTGAGVPLTFLSGAVAGSFNGSGNSKTPFLTNAAGLTVNMILDPILILVFDLGIVGAAIATVFAQGIVCLVSLLMIRLPRTGPFGDYSFRFRPDREMVRQIFRWSMPICLESMLFTLLSMMISRFVAAFGADAIAVQRVSIQVESMSWMIAGGFSTAVTAFVGQNYGAGKWSRIHRGNRIAFLLMGFWGVVVSVIIWLFGGALFGLFLPDPQLIAMGAECLKILAFCQLTNTIESTAMGSFRGLGRTVPPSVVSITSNALRVPLAYALSRTHLGLDGIWWGITYGAMLRGVWMFLWCLVMLHRQPKEDAAPVPAGASES